MHIILLSAIYGGLILSWRLFRHMRDIMKITSAQPTKSILGELGGRLRQQRIMLALTQVDLAETSGVPLRTIERLEAGDSVALEKFVKVLRALRLTWNLDQLVPPTGPTPMQQLGSRHVGERKRASKKAARMVAKGAWTWADQK